MIEIYFIHLNYYVCVWKALDAEREKFDREMLVHGKSLSEEEFKRLMAQHKHNINELENSYESEKDRQRKALEKKVRIYI